MNSLKYYLPEYVRTPHLPGSRADADDIFADSSDLARIFHCKDLWIEEKIDGANVGIGIVDGHPIARNRRNILTKGKQPKNPSGKQFLPLWNWIESHKDAIVELSDYTIYGEWLWMAHGIQYTQLPAYFVAFDLYDYTKNSFVPIEESRKMLQDVGFATPPLIHRGEIDSIERLEEMVHSPSVYEPSCSREGIYLRIADSRYKMVRHDFVPGKFWQEKIIKNSLARV